MKKSLTIEEWELIFHIDKFKISDLKGWNEYAFNEGLADYSTKVELEIVDAFRLSPLNAKTLRYLWDNYKN